MGTAMPDVYVNTRTNRLFLGRCWDNRAVGRRLLATAIGWWQTKGLDRRHGEEEYYEQAHSDAKGHLGVLHDGSIDRCTTLSCCLLCTVLLLTCR